MIAEEFKKEIKANHPAKIDFLISSLEKDSRSLIKQLSFQLSSILKPKDDENRKFYTELLEKNDDDYKFILRSFNKKNAENLPKLRQLFRISATDENEVYNYKEKNLYLHGVKVKEVKDILTNGFTEEEIDLDDSYEIQFEATTELSFEIRCGRNYCEADNTVKELSFVFVVCSEENYKNLNKKDSKLMEDTRSSVTREGLFGDDDNGIVENISDLIPAYLIIFEEDKV